MDAEIIVFVFVFIFMLEANNLNKVENIFYFLTISGSCNHVKKLKNINKLIRISILIIFYQATRVFLIMDYGG